MNDALFRDSPLWLERMYEKLDERITVALERDSRIYQMYKKQIETLYNEYPVFVDVVEGAEEHKSMTLNGVEAGKLSKLVRMEFDIMEMYQRAMYVIGVQDGIEFEKLFTDFGEKS